MKVMHNANGVTFPSFNTFKTPWTYAEETHTHLSEEFSVCCGVAAMSMTRARQNKFDETCAQM